MRLQRHYAATTYIFDKKSRRTLLHWHEKLRSYLPPGGHVEENEAPFETAKREILEEYELRNIEFIHPEMPRRLDERSFLLEMPHYLVEEIIRDDHIHLDWIFFAWVDLEELSGVSDDVKKIIRWFTIDEIQNEVNCFENVKELAIIGMSKFY